MMIRAIIDGLANRVFTERQIYHRSNGTVRYVRLSPGRQIGLVCVAAVCSAWFVFASASVAVGSKSISSTIARQKIGSLEQELQLARAGQADAVTQLTQRTEAFHDTIATFHLRNETMAALVSNLQDGGNQAASALAGNKATLLVTASIGESDERQPKRPPSTTVVTAQEAGSQRQLNHIRKEQGIVLDVMEDMIADRTEKARGVLRLTEIGEDITADNGKMGGPEIDLSGLLVPSAFANPEDTGFALRVAQIVARMEEAHHFEEQVRRLPLATPVAMSSRVTSPFGMRQDPLSKRPGWHAGIDMAAGWNAPIVAAGPGKVIFAGRRAGYGLVVDVDHGQGVVSRYAHMKNIAVKKGQDVVIGDRLGTMGSTGRSTGNHLHYEVRLDDKAYNPAMFIQAGQYVHQKK